MCAALPSFVEGMCQPLVSLAKAREKSTLVGGTKTGVLTPQSGKLCRVLFACALWCVWRVCSLAGVAVVGHVPLSYVPATEGTFFCNVNSNRTLYYCRLLIINKCK